MRFDFDHLSSRELDELIANAETRKAQLLSDPPAKPRVGEKASQRKRGKAAAKYRDPENMKDTWSGRGSVPRWLAAKIKRGMSTADFLIPGLARPTARKGGEVGRKSVFKRVI